MHLVIYCSDEPDAEEVCTTSIKKAIEHDESNPEGYQVLADYHLVKGELQVRLCLFPSYEMLKWDI